MSGMKTHTLQRRVAQECPTVCDALLMPAARGDTVVSQLCIFHNTESHDISLSTHRHIWEFMTWKLTVQYFVVTPGLQEPDTYICTGALGM